MLFDLKDNVALIMRFLFEFINFLKITIQVTHRNDGVGAHEMVSYLLQIKP